MAPRILWGPGYANVLDFGFPLYGWLTDRVAREGSSVLSLPALRESWVTGYDYVLAGVVRFVPDRAEDLGATPARALAAGPLQWQAFLDYARGKGPFRFVPDAADPAFYIPDCYLVAPMAAFGANNPRLERDFELVIRNATVDFGLALRGLLYEWAPGDPEPAGFSRGGPATYHSSGGTIRTAPAGVLRDRAWYNMAERGALLEDAATNLVWWSQNFGTAAWSTWIGAVVRSSGYSDPTGGTDAWLLTPATSVNSAISASTLVFTGDGMKVAGLYVKQVAASTVGFHLTLYDNSSGNTRMLLSGAFTTAGVLSVALGAGVGEAFPPERCADGWWRIGAKASTFLAADTHRFFIYPTGFAVSSQALLVFGAQAEDGPNLTSYIPTTGAATASRVADSWYVDWPYAPQAMWVYNRHVELYECTTAMNRRYWQIGTSGNVGHKFFCLAPQASTAQVQVGLAVTISTGSATALYIVSPTAQASTFARGSMLESLGIFGATGSVGSHLTIGETTTVAISCSPSLGPLPSSFGAGQLWLAGPPEPTATLVNTRLLQAVKVGASSAVDMLTARSA